MAESWGFPLPLTWIDDRIRARDKSLDANSPDLVEALTVSCIKGDLSAIKQRLPDDADLQPFQPLLAAAARYDQSSVVSYLLSKGFKIDSEARNGAVFCGEPTTFQLFLDHGWDINEPEGMFSGRLSYVFDNERLVRWFLAHGADPNRASPRGETPFDAAGGIASIPVLELLLQYGANIKSGGVLQHAIRSREYTPERFEVIEFLLERGADINKIETYLLPTRFQPKGTPLYVAASEGDEKVVKLLLERGADPSIRSTRGWTPMRAAKEHDHETVVALLLEHEMIASRAERKGKQILSCL